MPPFAVSSQSAGVRCTPVIGIDDSDGSAVDQALELTGGEGADRGCECVGYQCSCKGHEVPIISHELPLDEAPEAYKHFDARGNGWTKVILKPAA
jgi:threonine dehydrogenase-like Zn-dependent dehydrogenase